MITTGESRAAGELRVDGQTVGGKAMTFNHDELIVLGPGVQFVERFDSRSFSNVDTGPDVVMLAEHDLSKVLARRDSGSLSLIQDDAFLLDTATLVDSDLGRHYAASVRRGDTRYQSVYFFIESPDDETWARSEVTGEMTRVVHRARLRDVSLVAFPAYKGDATSISARAEYQLGRAAVREAQKETLARQHAHRARLLKEEM